MYFGAAYKVLLLKTSHLLVVHMHSQLGLTNGNGRVERKAMLLLGTIRRHHQDGCRKHIRYKRAKSP